MNSKTENLPPRPGCFLPLHSLVVHPEGHSHFCLTSTLPPEKSVEKGEQARRAVHTAWMAGMVPESCRRCGKKEKVGIRSRREGIWDRKVKRYGEFELRRLLAVAEAPAIRQLEISFSNLCNFNCAMCTGEFSSAWFGPETRAAGEGFVFPPRKIRQISPATLAEIEKHLDHLDLVIIKGGEPTIDPNCLAFLRKLAARARAKGGEKSPWVTVQTNGSRAPAEWLEELDGLDLQLGFSVDGWGEVYEWIRGGNFSRFLENLRFASEDPRVKLVTLDFTLSAFNLFHLPEFLSRTMALGREVKKIRECAIFQWAKEKRCSPLAWPREDRARIEKEIFPLLERGQDFFVGQESLLSVLRADSEPEAMVEARRWGRIIENLRNRPLAWEPAATAAMPTIATTSP